MKNTQNLAVAEARISVPELARPLTRTPNGIVPRGHERTICAGGPPVEVANLNARCAYGEVLAVVFGVSVRCADEDEPCSGIETNTPITLLRAYVQWGLGGVGFDAWLDIRRGAVVLIPAETIRVDAQLLAFAPFGFPTDELATASPVDVSVGFAYGSGAVKGAAQLTELVQIPAGAGTVQRIPIPPFAGSFTLVPDGSLTMRARLLTDGNGPFPTYEVTGPLGIGPTAVRLINSARCLEIVNTSDADPLTGFVIFGLEL